MGAEHVLVGGRQGLLQPRLAPGSRPLGPEAHAAAVGRVWRGRWGVIGSLFPYPTCTWPLPAYTSLVSRALVGVAWQLGGLGQARGAGTAAAMCCR